MAANSLIGNLAVNLTMETAAFQRGATIAEKRAEGMRAKFAGVGKSVAGIGTALVGGVIVAGLANVVGGAFEMASSMSEAAEKVGLTVEALQELRFAAQQTGVANEQLDAAIVRLSKSMGDLQLGEKEAVDAFAAIGLAAEDLKGKTPDEALRIVADRLNKIPDAATRVAIGQDLMGRGFSKLLPLINGGSEALNKYADESRKAGQISTEDAQRLDELADSWEKLKVRVGVATANIISGSVKFFGTINQGLIGLSESARNFDAAVAQMATNAVAAIGNMVTGIGQAITVKLNAIWEGAKAKVQAIGDKFKWLWNAVVGNSYIPDMVTAIGQEMGPRLRALMVAPASQSIDDTAAVFRDGAANMADDVKRSTGEVIEGFGQMAAGAIGSVKSMVQTFKSGDILGGIQQFLGLVMNVIQALGQLGVLKLPGLGSGIPTPRAQGGPVSPGRIYRVGERGPELVTFGSRGFVTPNRDNSQAARITVVPSPYFDAVVDQRAGNVAAPMVGRGMVASVTGAEMRTARHRRRSIP